MSGPADPFDSRWQFGEALETGKVLFEQVTRTGTVQETLRVLEALSEADLQKLAFYAAAENVADSVDRLAKMDPWLRWWRGVDSRGDDAPADVEGTPHQLWRIMRPSEDS